MKLRPNIYFVPWPSSSFSFSASFVASPLAEGCDAKVATSVEEGTLSKGNLFYGGGGCLGFLMGFRRSVLDPGRLSKSSSVGGR